MLKKSIVNCMVIMLLIFLCGSNCVAKEYQEQELFADLDSTFIQNVKSAILIEANSGKVIYEKNADLKLKPASVTKIMTLLLAFEKIDNNEMEYSDTVTVSQHAASMGGSQCFFEEGEEQNVDTILKCIEVASGNDAAVAMAEHIAGSEIEFVELMNKRADELGMINTSFKNACGLDVDGHYTSARDISIMSRELVLNHKAIYNYSTIWMDSITHKTKRGEKQFDLANTNKFLKNYNGACGLKTGYTKEAKYCISAVATRDDVTLIAVVLGADTKEIRNENVAKLLDYGFSKCKMYIDETPIQKDFKVELLNGKKDYMEIKEVDTVYIPLIDDNPDEIEKNVIINEALKAPISKGEAVGYIEYKCKNQVIEKITICSNEDIEKKNYSKCINDLYNKIFVLK